MNNIQIKRLLSHDFDFEELQWSELRPGVFISPFYSGEKSESASAALLKYIPGASVPDHLHTGYEHLIILKGEQEDKNGIYYKGDFIVNFPGTRHDVKSKTGCILLAIWEKPVKFLDNRNGD
jgi:predicted ChrR family anti-sigma factor